MKVTAFIPNPGNEDMEETTISVYEDDGMVAVRVGDREVLLDPEAAVELAEGLEDVVAELPEEEIEEEEEEDDSE